MSAVAADVNQLTDSDSDPDSDSNSSSSDSESEMKSTKPCGVLYASKPLASGQVLYTVFHADSSDSDSDTEHEDGISRRTDSWGRYADYHESIEQEEPLNDSIILRTAKSQAHLDAILEAATSSGKPMRGTNVNVVHYNSFPPGRNRNDGKRGQSKPRGAKKPTQGKTNKKGQGKGGNTKPKTAPKPSRSVPRNRKRIDVPTNTDDNGRRQVDTPANVLLQRAQKERKREQAEEEKRRDKEEQREVDNVTKHLEEVFDLIKPERNEAEEVVRAKQKLRLELDEHIEPYVNATARVLARSKIFQNLEDQTRQICGQLAAVLIANLKEVHADKHQKDANKCMQMFAKLNKLQGAFQQAYRKDENTVPELYQDVGHERDNSNYKSVLAQSSSLKKQCDEKSKYLENMAREEIKRRVKASQNNEAQRQAGEQSAQENVDSILDLMSQMCQFGLGNTLQNTNEVLQTSWADLKGLRSAQADNVSNQSQGKSYKTDEVKKAFDPDDSSKLNNLVSGTLKGALVLLMEKARREISDAREQARQARNTRVAEQAQSLVTTVRTGSGNGETDPDGMVGVTMHGLLSAQHWNRAKDKDILSLEDFLEQRRDFLQNPEHNVEVTIETMNSDTGDRKQFTGWYVDFQKDQEGAFFLVLSTDEVIGEHGQTNSDLQTYKVADIIDFRAQTRESKRKRNATTEDVVVYQRPAGLPGAVDLTQLQALIGQIQTGLYKVEQMSVRNANGEVDTAKSDAEGEIRLVSGSQGEGMVYKGQTQLSPHIKLDEIESLQLRRIDTPAANSTIAEEFA